MDNILFLYLFVHVPNNDKTKFVGLQVAAINCHLVKQERKNKVLVINFNMNAQSSLFIHIFQEIQLCVRYQL